MIKYHCLKIKGNEKLVEQSFGIFSNCPVKLPKRATYITCHMSDTTGFWTSLLDGYDLKDHVDHKEVYSLDEFFSINEALLLKYLKSKTKLGELL